MIFSRFSLKILALKILLLYTSVSFSTFDKSAGNSKKVVPSKQEVWILPLFTFYDVSRDATYNWWSESTSESVEARKHSVQLLSYLGKDNGKVIRFLDPYKMQIQLRKNLMKTVLSVEELKEISTDLKAELVLSGDMVVEDSPLHLAGKRLKIHLKILRAPTFHFIGEVVQVLDLHSFDHTQLLEEGGLVWVDLRANIERKIEDYNAKNHKGKVELIVNGTFNDNELKHLQVLLKKNIIGVKSLTKGYIEANSFGIFVEYEGADVAAFSKELQAFKWNGFMTQVVSSTSSQVIFDVHPQTAVK